MYAYVYTAATCIYAFSCGQWRGKWKSRKFPTPSLKIEIPEIPKISHSIVRTLSPPTRARAISLCLWSCRRARSYSRLIRHAHFIRVRVRVANSGNSSYFSHLQILTFEGEANGICRSDVCSSCRARWVLLGIFWKCSSPMLSSKVIDEERSGPSQNVWKKWKSYVQGRE